MRGIRGVNVVGYLRSESGVGVAARGVVRALDAAAVPVLPMHPPDVPPSRQGVPFATAALDGPAFDATLLCVTAYETAAFAAAAPSGFLTRRHTIGFWWWEVDVLPAFMHTGFDHVDEVWVGSEHVARAVRAATSEVPVTVVPVAVPRPAVRTVDRASLGLPADRFVFLTTFGHFSSVIRKNPMGAIEAFKRAFAPGAGPVLVVKSIDHEHHPEEHAQLEALAATHPDVLLMPGYVDERRMDELIAHADAVVSLHRAEGFGFTPATAMALGRPVVATGASGNLQYMDETRAFLVDAEIVPIGQDGGPYPPDGHWAEPDLDHAASVLRRVFEDPGEARARGEAAARYMAAHHAPARAGAAMRTLLERRSSRSAAAVRARVAARRLRGARTG